MDLTTGISILLGSIDDILGTISPPEHSPFAYDGDVSTAAGGNLTITH